MPDKNHTDHLHTLLRQARREADTLSLTMGEIEAELTALEKEVVAQVDFEVPVDQEEPIVFTQEEAEIMHLKMLLNVQEAAFLLGTKPAEIYRLIREGELPVCKIGRAVRVPTKALAEHIEAARGGEEGGSSGIHQEG